MKFLLRATRATLLTVFCFILIAPLVHAAECISVKIPFHVKLDGTLPSPSETYTFVLRSQDKTTPMPAGSIDSQYISTVSGSGDFFFPAISYSRVGVYSYQIYQKPGSTPSCAYDSAIYDVTILITNRDSMGGFESTIVVTHAGSTQKESTLSFINIYSVPAAPVNIAVIKKWVDSGTQHRPSNITVQLLQDNVIYDSVVLSSNNHWRYTWTGLPGNHQWNVVESNVPKGYTAAYQLENGVYTITNTAGLIQTGQLYWPIILFGIGGLLFILCGIIIFWKLKHPHV